MSTIDRLIAVADAYIEKTGSKPTTVSLRAFGHTTKLAALRSGRDIQARFADAGFQWFVLNWPEGQELPAILEEWRQTNCPEGLQRPSALSENLSGAPGGSGGA